MNTRRRCCFLRKHSRTLLHATMCACSPSTSLQQPERMRMKEASNKHERPPQRSAPSLVRMTYRQNKDANPHGKDWGHLVICCPKSFRITSTTLELPTLPSCVSAAGTALLSKRQACQLQPSRCTPALTAAGRCCRTQACMHSVCQYHAPLGSCSKPALLSVACAHASNPPPHVREERDVHLSTPCTRKARPPTPCPSRAQPSQSDL